MKLADRSQPYRCAAGRSDGPFPSCHVRSSLWHLKYRVTRLVSERLLTLFIPVPPSCFTPTLDPSRPRHPPVSGDHPPTHRHANSRVRTTTDPCPVAGSQASEDP